ncbi:uncharacterized protein DEA37_0009908 [Paragonimus westermani]|uniref:Reverse transcriptase domain-containing protein n=1 Tax=Paragonimus westermani TaxID=34504 RepID=A0A5J4P299_9TREM|nr:uncharacterized protein DEA37_0009908 [Paragonimus westermani]
MGLRKRDQQNRFILKPAEKLSVALTKARGCEALEQLDEMGAAEDLICLVFCQQSLTSEPLPRRNYPAVPVGGECCYCKRFGRRAQHCGHNPPTGSRSPKVDLKKGRPAEVCSTVDSKAKAPFEIEVLVPLGSDENLQRVTTQPIHSLSEFKDVFALGYDALGRTSLVQREIDTLDHRPIRQAPQRLPVHYDTMITEMLEKRIIRPSASPWSSSIVLVGKKNGALRLCVNYRKIHKITAKDSFPIPRIDVTLDALHGAQWFSTLDLASGYW